MAEVWWRNPTQYITELKTAMEFRVLFYRDVLVKRSIDPIKFMSLHFAGQPWGLMISETNVTIEYSSESPEKPIGVYPTFRYGDSMDDVEEAIAHPVGDNDELCSDKRVPIAQRYVKGQMHRVVITDLPDVRQGPGRHFLSILRELQIEYPACTIHISGTYAMQYMCRMGFKAWDFDPGQDARYGKIILPTGYQVNVNKQPLNAHKKWIDLFGFLPVDMNEPRKRCVFNIRSIRWAADNFAKDIKPVVRYKPGTEVDTMSPDSEFTPIQNNRTFWGNKNPVPRVGDKFSCNSCSLARECKYYREGSVCTLPDSEARSLASYFNTRDASTILDGLGLLTADTAQRYQQGRQMEISTEMLDPEVTKLGGALERQATRLAQLIDPNLRSSKVQVNVGGTAGISVGEMSPQAWTAKAISVLEDMGFSRKEITKDMIKGVLEGKIEPPQPRYEIEG
jgi:hypothetical protein